MRILTRSDIRPLLDELELINLVKIAFSELASGKAVQPHRGQLVVENENGLVLIMPGLLSGIKAMGVKVVTVYPDNPVKFGIPNIMATTLLMDTKTGEPVCLMDATYLTAARTGAVCAVATRLLADEHSTSLGLIGTGAQAEAIASFICSVRPISTIRAYSDDVLERKEAFASRVSQKTGIQVELTDSAEVAVREADVITTATSSKKPVIDFRWIKPGAHINAIGNHDPHCQELDSETVKNSIVICDDVNACLTESGDLIIPLNQGLVDTGHFEHSLGDVIRGKNLVRESDRVTLFKSIGLAIQDVVAAEYIYRKAVNQGKGTDLNLVR